MMPLFNQIKPFLESRGIRSVYSFRKQAGIASETAYKLYKNPEHLPSPRTLEKICDTYKIQPSEVLEWRER